MKRIFCFRVVWGVCFDWFWFFSFVGFFNHENSSFFLILDKIRSKENLPQADRIKCFDS